MDDDNSQVNVDGTLYLDGEILNLDLSNYEAGKTIDNYRQGERQIR